MTCTMRRRHTLLGLLLLMVTPVGAATLTYEVRFDATWSSTSHPQEFPASAHFSPPFGAVHDEIWPCDPEPEPRPTVHASLAGDHRAIDGLRLRPDRVLLDGTWDFVGGGISETIVKIISPIKTAPMM